MRVLGMLVAAPVLAIAMPSTVAAQEIDGGKATINGASIDLISAAIREARGR